MNKWSGKLVLVTKGWLDTKIRHTSLNFVQSLPDVCPGFVQHYLPKEWCNFPWKQADRKTNDISRGHFSVTCQQKVYKLEPEDERRKLSTEQGRRTKNLLLRLHQLWNQCAAAVACCTQRKQKILKSNHLEKILWGQNSQYSCVPYLFNTHISLMTYLDMAAM